MATKHVLWMLEETYHNAKLEISQASTTQAMAFACVGWIAGMLIGGVIAGYFTGGVGAVTEYVAVSIIVMPVSAILAVVIGGGIGYLSIDENERTRIVEELEAKHGGQ